MTFNPLIDAPVALPELEADTDIQASMRSALRRSAPMDERERARRERLRALWRVMDPVNLRTLLTGLALGAWLGRRTLRRVADWCGHTATMLRALGRSPSACRQTIAAGAWQAADPSHLSDTERIGLARRLVRLSGVEDEIEEYLADPGLNVWPGTKLMSTARPPLTVPAPRRRTGGVGRDRRMPPGGPATNLTDRRESGRRLRPATGPPSWVGTSGLPPIGHRERSSKMDDAQPTGRTGHLWTLTVASCCGREMWVRTDCLAERGEIRVPHCGRAWLLRLDLSKGGCGEWPWIDWTPRQAALT